MTIALRLLLLVTLLALVIPLSNGVVFAEPEIYEDGPATTVEVGVSFWFSQAETKWSHNASGLDPNLGNPSSRLMYKDVGTNIAELTGTVRFKNRLFVRSNFGYGEIGGGRLIDEDFLSAQGAVNKGATISGAHAFSKTFSDITGDDLWYVNVDTGIRAMSFTEDKGFLDLFVGFQYWREQHETRGLTQITCTTVTSPDPAFQCPAAGAVRFEGQPVITNKATWISGRVGVESEYRLLRRVSVNGKLAVLVTQLRNEDTHHLRTDLQQNPSFKMSGLGFGTNVEGNVRILVIERFFLSAGYRFWWTRVTDEDWELFGANGASLSANLNEFETIRHGPTVGILYTF